jgi:hypothetical protein
MVGAPFAVAAVAFGVGQLSNAGSSESKTVGKVPGVEACGPEATATDTVANIRKAVAYQACRMAVTTAANVVNGKAPVEGMYVTETTSVFDTTFGKPSYTVAQKSAEAVDPANIQEYRVSFAVNAEGEADLSDIVTITGNNGTDLGAIDHYTRDGKSMYVAGFRDPQGPDVPLYYAADTTAGANRLQDASNAALAAFVPWKS